jgi:septin 7
MEEERRDHEAKMKKMEQEMEQVFEMKVKEKTQKLKDSETDVTEISLDSVDFSFISFWVLLFHFYSCNVDTNRRSVRSRPRNWNWKRSVKPLRMKN